MDDKTLREFLQPKLFEKKETLQSEVTVKFSSSKNLNKPHPENLFKKIPEIKHALGNDWEVAQHEKNFIVSHKNNKDQFTITPDELKTKQPNYEVLKAMSKVSSSVKKNSNVIVIITNFSTYLNEAFKTLVQNVKSLFPNDTIQKNSKETKKSMGPKRPSEIESSPRRKSFN